MSIGKAANDNVVPAYGPFPPTMASAKALGSKYYFTGKPCLRGHIVARYAHGSCTECKAEDRAADREGLAAKSRQWRLDNPEKVRGQARTVRSIEASKANYERTREHQIERAKQWKALNPERTKANGRRWLLENQEYVKKRRVEKYAARTAEEIERARLAAIRWRAENPERNRELSRLWREANPEKSAATDRNKKAKRKSAEGTHTAEDIQTLLRLQKNKCAECNTSILVTGYHVDHIMPLALGGTNWPNNLQILCPACNMHKHATDPIVFAQRKGRLL